MGEDYQTEMSSRVAPEPKGSSSDGDHHIVNIEEGTKTKGNGNGNEAEQNLPSISTGRILNMARDKYMLLALGSFCALTNGATLPAFSVVFGEMFDLLTKSSGEIKDNIWKYGVAFLGIGVFSFILSFFMQFTFIYVGEIIARRLREKYFSALMLQPVEFFDRTSTGEITSRLSGDIVLVQGGMSEKLGQTIFFNAQALGGLAVAFYYGWRMTLILLGCAPILVLAGILQMRWITLATKTSTGAYGRAGSLATEMVGGIRTVLSFVAEQLEWKRYSESLVPVLKAGKKKGVSQGLGHGFSNFMIFGVYCVGFWVGGTFVADGYMGPGDLLSVFFAVVIGAMGLGQAQQLAPDIAKAKGAASKIFKVIDEAEKYQTQNQQGLVLDSVRGDIAFDEVTFRYPTRPDAPVLRNLSITADSGQTVALVGPSGGGKSTILQLLERFYDPLDGSIYVDGHDICDLNRYWLRQQIGLVSQEPILFDTTLLENIRYGKPHATEEEVIRASRAANAHDFIMSLPDQYATQAGEKGLQLSGGQKQRVAIARAVLKDPAILLLDEATSALDAESEKIVQDALDRLMENRTTIVIAHRLSTVRGADKIVVLQEGACVEEGTHSELLERAGTYRSLVERQMTTGELGE
eukprot:TRINITY_DN40015_c0_g1_i1.p1 TRINITY_DN40015_c0_g1~~TRINITY_DN40015_c0_g1_i1.p1  ORF type:complete len:635 (-),score=137.91 TRINITY_DN40015_c0_g1_i1:896-2800(-)